LKQLWSLRGAIIDKKMFEKRDTLVLPILHNARHAVELSLKFATDRLTAAGLVPAPERRNHNIKAYWDRLHAASLGDEKLSQTIKAMKPFIDSLSRIDRDGQELRYHLNNADDQSLSEYSLANLEGARQNILYVIHPSAQAHYQRSNRLVNDRLIIIIISLRTVQDA
jgi:hypothetical protein